MLIDSCVYPWIYQHAKNPRMHAEFDKNLQRSMAVPIDLLRR